MFLFRSEANLSVYDTRLNIASRQSETGISSDVIRKQRLIVNFTTGRVSALQNAQTHSRARNSPNGGQFKLKSDYSDSRGKNRHHATAMRGGLIFRSGSRPM